MAVRLDKIYTKSGDDGKTNILSDRIDKGDIVIECFSAADELNSSLGVIRSFARQFYEDKCEIIVKETESTLTKIQNEMFEIGKILVYHHLNLNGKNTIKEHENPVLPKFGHRNILFLEERIDNYLAVVTPLNSFILPGGNLLVAYTHHSRSICRRFECVLNRWDVERQLESNIKAFVNRLSDYLFVYSRWVTHQLGEKEECWIPASN